MKWPFKSKKETDIRIFRDTKTDEVTLRLIGPMCLPSSENPILSISVQMDVRLDEQGIQRLHEQLSHFARKEVGSARRESPS